MNIISTHLYMDIIYTYLPSYCVSMVSAAICIYKYVFIYTNKCVFIPYKKIHPRTYKKIVYNIYKKWIYKNVVYTYLPSYCVNMLSTAMYV
jgi:hypothetical protein